MTPKVTDPEIRSAIRESRRIDMVRDIAAGLAANPAYINLGTTMAAMDPSTVGRQIGRDAVAIADAVLAHELATRPGRAPGTANREPGE